MIRKHTITMLTCALCGETFRLGYDGVHFPGHTPLCDTCAGIERCRACGGIVEDGVCTNCKEIDSKQ